MEKLDMKLRRASDRGIFHDSREDARLLAKVINACHDKINELIEEICELKEEVQNLKSNPHA